MASNLIAEVNIIITLENTFAVLIRHSKMRPMLHTLCLPEDGKNKLKIHFFICIENNCRLRDKSLNTLYKSKNELQYGILPICRTDGFKMLKKNFYETVGLFFGPLSKAGSFP